MARGLPSGAVLQVHAPVRSFRVPLPFRDAQHTEEHPQLLVSEETLGPEGMDSAQPDTALSQTECEAKTTAKAKGKNGVTRESNPELIEP